MVELEKETNKIRNIILIDKKGYIIYTIDDDENNIEIFLKNLKEFLPLVDSFNQSFFEKTIRFLKL